MADCSEEQKENKLRKEKASKKKDQWALPLIHPSQFPVFIA